MVEMMVTTDTSFVVVELRLNLITLPRDLRQKPYAFISDLSRRSTRMILCSVLTERR